MNVDFSKNKPSAAPAPAPIEAPTVNVAATVIPAPAPAISVPATAPKSKALTAPIGLALGDRLPSFEDVIMPRLNIVQNVGDLKDSFPLGAIVFNQATVLFTPPIVNAKSGIQEKAASAPLIITCLGFRPDRFVEKVQGGRGMIVK